MAGAKKLKLQLDKKQKDAAEKLRYGNKTEKQKKFLKENPNSFTAQEMEKKISDLKSKAATKTKMSPGGYEELKTGGRAGYKGGKSVKKMGCAIKGKSPILR